jgi:predicted metal-dependent hydrolase
MQQVFKISINNNNQIDIAFTKKRNIKKIILRFNAKTRQPVVSLPYSITFKQALDFVNDNINWLEEHLSKVESRVNIIKNALQDGEVEILGSLYQIICHQQSKNTAVFINNEIIIFYTDPKNIEAIFTKHLKIFIKNYFYNKSLQKANLVNKAINKVIISGANTKWGSCSNKGNLRYNFRLAFAPLFVVDYLIAHEVAHLVHFNHSSSFWELVDELTNYKIVAKDWLKQNGKDLF